MAIDLVVTDLDGTLWDGVAGVHERTLAALKRLAELKVPILAATARRPAAAMDVMREHGVLLPAVLFDGALGRDFAANDTFHRAPIPRTAALAIIDAFYAHGLEPCLNVDGDDSDFLVGEKPSTHPRHLAYNAPRTRRTDIRTAAATSEILSMIVCGVDRDLLDPISNACLPWADAVISADRTYGGHSLSVCALGVSKWSGVEAYCSLRGFDPLRILAVGDGENDLELLTRAAIACVPEDGCDAALALATHTIPCARDGGWADILRVLGI